MTTAVVTGVALFADGTVPSSCTVRATVLAPGGGIAFADTGAAIIAPVQVQANTSTGAFSLTLFCTTLMSPPNCVYRLDFFPASGTPLPSGAEIPSFFITVPLGGGTAENLQTGAPVPGVNQFSIPSHPYLYLPDGWNAGWQSAKTTVGSSVARLAIIGDSTSSGSSGSSDWQTKPWPMRVRANLASLYGLAGDYWPVARNLTHEITAYTYPWTIGVNYSAQNYGLAQGYIWVQAGVPNPIATFSSANTPNPNVTQIDALFMDVANTGGNVTLSLDSGGGQVLSSPGAYKFAKKSFTGLSATSHTLAWTLQSTDNALCINGVNAWSNLSAGIFFEHLDWGGEQAWNEWGQYYANFPHDRCNLLQGPTGADDDSIGFGAPVQPHLAIIALGINDCQVHIGYHSFEKTLIRMCQALRRGVPNCSILFVGMYNPDPVNSDQTSGLFTDSQNWPLYLAAMDRVARAFTAGFVNVHSKWAPNGVSLGFTASSNAHPTDAGHADIATLIGGLL